MSAPRSNLCCCSAFSYLCPVLLPIIETVTGNPEPCKSEFSLIVHRRGITTHLKIGVGAVYLSICFRSHVSHEWFMYTCLCIFSFFYSEHIICIMIAFEYLSGNKVEIYKFFRSSATVNLLEMKICHLGYTINLRVLEKYVLSWFQFSVFYLQFSLQLPYYFEKIVSSPSSVLSPLQWEDFCCARSPG